MQNRTEIASKAMGLVKGLEATFRGFQGIFKTLTEEHGAAGAMLKRIAETPDPKVRADIWPSLRRALREHEYGEINVLYLELRNHEALRRLTNEHDREAREMAALIMRLDECAYDQDEWQSHAEKLRELVKHHTEVEEATIFPQAQAVLGEGRAVALKDAYCEQKRETNGSSGTEN